jgi:hypothetical protein
MVFWTRVFTLELFRIGDNTATDGLARKGQFRLVTKFAVNLALGLRQTRQRDAYGADGVKRGFSILSPQSMQIGSLNLPQVSFAVSAESGDNVLTSEEDGLLSTALFRRIFISYADRFVVLEPRW